MQERVKWSEVENGKPRVLAVTCVCASVRRSALQVQWKETNTQSTYAYVSQQNEIPQSAKCYAANVILNRRIHNMHIPQSVC